MTVAQHIVMGEGVASQRIAWPPPHRFICAEPLSCPLPRGERAYSRQPRLRHLLEPHRSSVAQEFHMRFAASPTSAPMNAAKLTTRRSAPARAERAPILVRPSFLRISRRNEGCRYDAQSRIAGSRKGARRAGEGLMYSPAPLLVNVGELRAVKIEHEQPQGR
jgi:hypothetical protein